MTNPHPSSRGYYDLLPSCVILLNGYPGVGKYTVAREMQKKLNKPNQVIRLIDNHLLLDPVEAIEPGRTPLHYELRRRIRNVAFDALTTLCDPHSNLVIIMTSCLAANDADAEIFAEHEHIARMRNIPLCFFNLICDRHTNTTRLQSEQRAMGSKTKLREVETLHNLLDYQPLFDPRKSQVETGDQDIRIIFLKMETSCCSAAEAADTILDLTEKHICRFPIKNDCPWW